jgi:hypothetical protein
VILFCAAAFILIAGEDVEIGKGTAGRRIRMQLLTALQAHKGKQSIILFGESPST